MSHSSLNRRHSTPASRLRSPSHHLTGDLTLRLRTDSPIWHMRAGNCRDGRQVEFRDTETAPWNGACVLRELEIRDNAAFDTHCPAAADGPSGG